MFYTMLYIIYVCNTIVDGCCFKFTLSFLFQFILTCRSTIVNSFNEVSLSDQVKDTLPLSQFTHDCFLPISHLWLGKW